jgi:hypothetical protein
VRRTGAALQLTQDGAANRQTDAPNESQIGQRRSGCSWQDWLFQLGGMTDLGSAINEDTCDPDLVLESLRQAGADQLTAFGFRSRGGFGQHFKMSGANRPTITSEFGRPLAVP